MSTVSAARQLSFVDAGASSTEWGTLTPITPARTRHRARNAATSEPGETVTISTAEYQDLLEAREYRQRDRDRSRRTKTLRAELRPVAPVYADRSAADPRPVAKARTGPGRHQVQNRPDRSRSKGGLRGLTPEFRNTINPYSPLFDGRTEQVARLITEAGVPITLTGCDNRAVKRCKAEPQLIAEAFIAAARGDWDDRWLRRNLSVKAVINRLSAYQLSRQPTVTNGSRGMSPTAYSHDPWAGQTPPIAAEDLAAFYGSRMPA